MSGSFNDMRHELGAIHATHPQRHWHIQDAINGLEAAIDKLASLGHRYDIIEAKAIPYVEWPKMFYNWSTGATLTIPSAESAAALSSDWHDVQQPIKPMSPIGPEDLPTQPPPAMLGVDAEGKPTLVDHEVAGEGEV